MPRIQRLPAELASQIAAGEVIERPASVVKELVENALDAGAQRITITIQLGGKKLVRVDDDGEGMDADDARLALERHATSKLLRAQDLVAIRTLGFRGEALPSIASVSHLLLRTRARGMDSGTEIRANGGAIASVREIGAPEGTTVEVSDLFYNLPARRKFLKADTAEAAQVSRIVRQVALAYPDVGFTLSSAGHRVLECPPVTTPAERFFQLYGERPDLVEVRKEVGSLKLSGYVAALADQGPARGPQNIFVNRRVVRDRTIAHAVADAYSVATIKERSPEVHLFLEVPPDRVDVNVHPTKAEVRFLEPSLVHEVIRRALADALGGGPAPELQFRAVTVQSPVPMPQMIPGIPGASGFAGRWPTQDPQGWGAGDVDRLPASAGTLPAAPEAAGAREPGHQIRPMIPLGQFRDTFIIAVDDEGIAIVDQHVAHERVLFEQVMERLDTGRLESQRLLEPLLIDLPPTQREALMAHGSQLDRFGFAIEEFGGNSVRIAAVPVILTPTTYAAAVRALAEDLEGLDRSSRLDDALRRIAATTACHAAVKANYPLTQEKMRYILDELRRTAYSTVCPHGRPVVLRVTRREIERNFQRI